MGACSFYTESYGKDVYEAFENAYNEAVYEYGNGSYSGTIKEKDGVQLLQKPKRKSLDKFVNEMLCENDKWGPAYAVCIEEGSKKVIEKVPNGSTVNKSDFKGTRQWKTFYVTYVIQNGIQNGIQEVGKHEKQAESLKFARQYVERNNCEVEIMLEKRIVNTDNHIATIKPKVKEVSSKVPHNKYLLFGMASC